MPFSRPSLQDIIDRIISDFNTRVSNSTTFLRNSVFYIFAKVYGGACHLLYDFLNYCKNQVFVTTADAENLDLHGSEYGITRSYGTRATGTIIISGDNGATLSAGSELEDATGQRYTADAAATIAAGIASVAVTAKEVGVSYDQDSGTELNFTSFYTGINTSATVSSAGITGGVNEETTEEYRVRILNRKRLPPHGGIENDYVTWAQEYTGVTRAWAIPLYQGVGTIGLAFVMDNEDDIFPDEATRTAVKDYIVSHTDSVSGKTVGVPVTAEPGFFVPEISAYTMNFTIALDPNTSTVQESVENQLIDLILTRGGAGQTITISQMYEAIATATGEERSRIEYPTGDATASTTQVHVLGEITFEEY